MAVQNESAAFPENLSMNVRIAEQFVGFQCRPVCIQTGLFMPLPDLLPAVR